MTTNCPTSSPARSDGTYQYGFKRREPDVGGEHRRWPFGLADDHDHGVDGLAVLVHEQPLLRGIDEDVALLAGREDPRPLEVQLEDLALLVVAIFVLADGVAKLAVERVHPPHLRHIVRK